MPNTFSHPLAVLPLQWLLRGRLNFAALIIGSMSPDFGYYIKQLPIARFAHTIGGTVAVCLPSGLLVLVIFYWLRQPLCFLLPQPHRTALTPLAAVRPEVSVRSVIVAAISILLGAWSHTIWDSFTHDGAWTVSRLPFLSAELFRVGDTVLSGAYVLQQASTLGGAIALMIFYFLWLRRQPIPVPAIDRFSKDGWRYLTFAVIVLIAFAVAIPAALRLSSSYEGYTALRVFVFRTGVYSMATFVPLFVLSSIIYYSARGRKG